jgi:hypothetical protein
MIGRAFVSLVGGMLINALLPPPSASTSANQAAALAAPSPTYNLAAQGNSARLDAAIPEHFGRMMAYLDLASQPYVEYAGNEQYLYQLFCLGRGEYSIEALRIEDTPIASFDEITYEVVPPGGSLSLFPANVITAPEVSGQTLDCLSGTYAGNTITATGHGLATGKNVYLGPSGGGAGTYAVVTAPDANTFTVSGLSGSGTISVSPWLGGFNANGSGTSANTLGLDMVATRGLYHANTTTGGLDNVSIQVAAECRPIDDSGNPTGAWASLASPTYSGATTTPQRYSLRSGVTPGRYQVRARRVDVKQTDSTYGHEIVWASLRAYLPDTGNYGDVTLIAMRMKASNNLSMQASRKVNVIATRKLPIWNGSAWSAKTATRSIAWAAAYACKQLGLTDAQIDLAGLLTLDTTWAARGDTFDARFDNFISFWEALSKIAGAGRAKPYMQGGVVRLVRDQAVSLPVALYSMRNIVKGSLSVEYLMPTPSTADAVDVSYFDQTSWSSRKVRAMLAGSIAAVPAKIDLFGVVSRDQAFREGMYQAASNRYRRKIIHFATEMEGFIPSLGDLIAIQHDMPGWGQAGDVIAWDAPTLTLTLSEPLTWGTGTHYLALRKRDGGVDGPYVVTANAYANQAILATAPAITPYTGGDAERTHYTFGWAETWRQPARVLSAVPRSLTLVEITAVGEDNNVHTAEVGLIAPAPKTSQLANYDNAPIVLGLITRSQSGFAERMLITWQPSPWADYYVIEQSGDGVNWTRTGESSTSNYQCTALYGGATLVRVAAVGIAKGPWSTVSFAQGGSYMYTTNSNLMYGISTNLMWKA